MQTSSVVGLLVFCFLCHSEVHSSCIFPACLIAPPWLVSPVLVMFLSLVYFFQCVPVAHWQLCLAFSCRLALFPSFCCCSPPQPASPVTLSLHTCCASASLALPRFHSHPLLVLSSLHLIPFTWAPLSITVKVAFKSRFQFCFYESHAKLTCPVSQLYYFLINSSSVDPVCQLSPAFGSLSDFLALALHCKLFLLLEFCVNKLRDLLQLR